MFDNTISLCMIVKNEEKNIKKCLDSVASSVDEVIIVDTGSTDNTIEIAKSYGAKVFFHKWNNDFSAARNASIEQATKNWILFLDADEEMDLEEIEKLKNVLTLNTNLEAFHLRLVNIISSASVGDAIVLRVFKNKKEYRFEGPMHEQIVKSIEKFGGPNCIGATDIKINHYGYDPELADIAQKQKRNLELLNSYPQSKRDGYFYYSLGNEYARIGEHDKALETYDKALAIPLKKGERPVYMAYLYLHIAKVLNSARRYTEEIKRLHSFEKNYRDFKDLYFMECLAYMECNMPSKAKMALDKYLGCNQVSYEYPSSDFEKFYKMDDLVKMLNDACVPHEEKLLSVLILCYEDEPTLVNTIKSVNEIADEVIIATPKGSSLNREPLINIGATIVDVKNDDKESVFMKGSFKCKGKYILLMKPKEVCTLDNQKNIINLLSNTTVSYFNVSILNQQTSITSCEFRLFENSKILRKIKKFDEYAQFVHSNEIVDSEITVHLI